MQEAEPELIWPSLLRAPSPLKPLIYLDLNHWIYLAQAKRGHVSGKRVVATLDAARQAKRSGEAVFVLSGSLYVEMAKILDPAQRAAVGDVMEELTEFSTLMSRVVVMELELDAALHHRGFPGPPFATVELLGRGVKHAFGLEAGFQIMGPSGDETEQVRQRFGSVEFDRRLAELWRNFERSSLRGPTDDEVPDLRKEGWKPEVAIATAERRAQQEREQTIRLDGEGGRWRRGDLLRRVVVARELMIEFQNILPRALTPRRITLEQIADNPQGASLFVRSMPSTAVALEIKAAWHRNRDKKWTANDVYDIDALAIAVP